MQNKSEIKIREELFSARPEEVIDALNMIKEKGNAAYLPLLFNILKNNPEEEIEKEIIFILNNLKTKSAVQVMADALTDPDYLAIRKKLTSACWQNGLDFRDSLPVFVDLIIGEDWETGFEAFTVIENMNEFPAQNILDAAKEKIAEALKEAEGQKRYLLLEVLRQIG